LTSELCQIIADELFFFTWHIFLKVGQTQDLPSKIWQTLEDGLTNGEITFGSKLSNSRHISWPSGAPPLQ
jgi:hypothetical protein